MAPDPSMTKQNGEDRSAPHHHCCHHHTSHHSCHQQKESQPQVQEKEYDGGYIQFRPKAGPGLWLPALLPVSCVALGILSGFSSAAPLMILSLMSCCCCYQMLHSRYSIKSLPLTSFSSESSPNQNSSESFVCKKSSTWQYKSYCVALQPIKSDSTDRRLQILCISVAVILLYQAPNAGFVMATTSVLVNVAVVVVVNTWLVTHHSQTFSVGEWLLAGECVGVCVSSCVYGLLSGCSIHSPYTHCQLHTFIQLSALLSGLLLLLLLLLPPPTSPLLLLPLTAVVGGVGVLWSSLMLGEFSPLWLLGELFGSRPGLGWGRVLLLCWWAACSVMAWLTTKWVYRYRAVPVPVVRKTYHVLAVVVCVAGVAVDASFLHLASVAATIACLIAEVVRVLDVAYVAPTLSSAFASFLDEKDRSGRLILSPIYLLVGLSLPLWLLPLPLPLCPPSVYCSPCGNNFLPFTPSYIDPLFRNFDSENSILKDESEILNPENGKCFNVGTERFDYENNNQSIENSSISSSQMILLQLAGVLAVGIGDTFASIGGIRYGRHKYPGSNKTIEGSACGIASQVMVILVLVVLGWVNVGYHAMVWWMGVLITIFSTSIVEAFTNQVDNLALPLITFTGFCVTEYFAAA